MGTVAPTLLDNGQLSAQPLLVETCQFIDFDHLSDLSTGSRVHMTTTTAVTAPAATSISSQCCQLAEIATPPTVYPIARLHDSWKM